MKTNIKKTTRMSVSDAAARDTRDLKPMNAEMKRRWEAARRTGSKAAIGRPPKAADEKSRIVPVSIEPKLLAAVDRYAKRNGLTRSGLVAEALRARIAG